jgi:hypothetical protein
MAGEYRIQEAEKSRIQEPGFRIQNEEALNRFHTFPFILSPQFLILLFS